MNGLGASASVSFSIGSGPKPSSKSTTKKPPATKAEFDKKAAAERAASDASDLGARFFGGETNVFPAAKKAVQVTMALYAQARDLAQRNGQSIFGMNGTMVTAAERATDYTDRIEELQVASDEMTKQLALRMQGKAILPPKRPTSNEVKIMGLQLFGKSMGLRSAQLPPEPQGPSLTTWLIVGAVVIAAGGGYYYYTTKKG